MAENDKIRDLKRQIAEEEAKMSACNEHDFGKVFYNPTFEMQGYGSKMVPMGSDTYFEPVGYRKVEVGRWTKKCLKCGYESHATNKKPIISGYEPDFKD
jgi:hypothetical protein